MTKKWLLFLIPVIATGTIGVLYSIFEVRILQLLSTWPKDAGPQSILRISLGVVSSLILALSYWILELKTTTSASPHLNPDKELFNKLLTELPPDGEAIYFLEGHDISAPFEASVLDPLDSFNRYWNDAMHEFHNKKLEEKRKELYQKMNAFREKLSVNIFSSNRVGWYTMDFEDYETDRDKLRTRDELNEMARETYAKYQELIRIGRRL